MKVNFQILIGMCAEAHRECKFGTKVPNIELMSAKDATKVVADRECKNEKKRQGNIW